MIALIQRVSEAAVRVDGEVVGEIDRGLLVLLGVEKDDDEAKAKRLMERVTTYRVFEDDEGKMNLNVKQVEGKSAGGFSIYAACGYKKRHASWLFSWCASC